jgi:hypothetical protein
MKHVEESANSYDYIVCGYVDKDADTDTDAAARGNEC